MRSPRRSMLTLILCGFAALVSTAAPSPAQTPASGQTWPQHPVKFVIPLGPGSGVDITARVFADKLSAKWGQPVIVENRPGGDAVIPLALFFFSLPVITKNSRATQIRNGWKDISGTKMMEYVRELCSEKYSGRLSGTKGYDDAAAWLAGLLAKWRLVPAGDSGTYFQNFPNPYTLVLPGAELFFAYRRGWRSGSWQSLPAGKGFFPRCHFRKRFRDRRSGVRSALASAPRN